MNFQQNVKYSCRTCLEHKNDLISLYSVNTETGLQFFDMVLQVTQVPICNKSNAPMSICADCRYKLSIAFQFQQQCKNSDMKLQEQMRSSMLDQNDRISTDKCIPLSAQAVQEFFGNEGEDQENCYQPNLVLSTDIDSNLRSNDLLNMDIILENNKSPKTPTTKKSTAISKKSKQIKKKTHLDELLKTHKERMKVENSSKLQIFKQKRKKKLTALIEPEQCFQCGKVFHYKGYMELHLRTHSNFKAYECNICHKKFTQVSNLNLHTRTHTLEKPFACEKCPKLFSTSSNLKVHLKIHTGIKDHVCSLCDKAFKTASELKSHEGTHSQVKTKVCKFCGKSFYKTAYLNVHIKNIHFGEKKFKCDSINCSKVFSNSSNLIAHKRIHTGEKPYACKRDNCDAKFNQSSSLVRHMKSHNKITKIKIVEEKEEELLLPIVKKKTSYIIPEILKDTFNSDNIQSIDSNRLSANPTPSQQPMQQLQEPSNYVIPPQQQSLLPEALNPMNLISNSTTTATTTTSNYNPNPHSTSSLLMPSLPTHHEPAPPMADHQIHHFSNFDNTTTYLPPTPNILSNSFNFMIGSLDFSKNNLNGEPTYIDY